MFCPGSHRVLAARNSITDTDAISRKDEERRLPELLETGGLSTDNLSSQFRQRM